MTYVYDCDHRHDLPFAEVKRLVGGKAANLAVMALDLGLPGAARVHDHDRGLHRVPRPGLAGRSSRESCATHMARMEELTGRRFGDPADPLLVSVRSGAPISMPGMMDTILNLGLNDATTAGLAAVSGSEKFAANCRKRFEAMFRDIVGGEEVPEDPWDQLRAAVEAVFRSWNSDRARAYRQREGIPDDLGTAVTVQAMVFGNRSVDSGTGVLFTRNPATGEPVLYGDVMFNAQGEDVVAGTHATEPIAVLDERIPAVGRRAPRVRRAARAPQPRPVRHRVHDRARQALDAPVPDRQAEPPGGAADRGRHGRGPGVRAHEGGGRRAGRGDPRRPADADHRARRRRTGARRGACRRRPAWRAARSSRARTPPSPPPRRAGR